MGVFGIACRDWNRVRLTESLTEARLGNVMSAWRLEFRDLRRVRVAEGSMTLRRFSGHFFISCCKASSMSDLP